MWAIAPLASGLRCAWPGRGQPWTSAAWPPWVWREDGWTGPTMSERRTARNRLCLKTQCGEAASLGEPWGSAEKRDHGLFWEEEQGLPSPSAGMQHRLMETEARTPCPCPWAWAHTPSYSPCIAALLAALPLSRLAGHPGQGATFHLPPSTPGRKHESPDLLAAGLPGPVHTKLEGWHAGLLLPCHTASCYTSKEFWLKSKKTLPRKKGKL